MEALRGLTCAMKLALVGFLAFPLTAAGQNFYATGGPAQHVAAVPKASFAASPERESADLSAAARSAGEFYGQTYVTNNFEIHAPQASLAKHVGDAAEKYRRDLATLWLGQPLADWSERCPIQVVITGQAEGETSFLLPDEGRGMPSDWRMTVKGPVDRLMDSVLPHEITHTIMATHFKQRLPRWVDEGACTTVEHPSEKAKIHSMLMDFLSPQQQKGLPFNRMFVMREYPRDILPLYAQGYSVSRFLISQADQKHFTQFIQAGLDNEMQMAAIPAWTQAVQQYYQYESLSDLQLQWLDWVQGGSNEQSIASRLSGPNTAESEIRLATAQQPIPMDARGTAAGPSMQPNVTAGRPGNFYLQQQQAPFSRKPSTEALPTLPSSIDSQTIPAPPLKTAPAEMQISEQIPGRGPVTNLSGGNATTTTTPKSPATDSNRTDSTILLRIVPPTVR